MTGGKIQLSFLGGASEIGASCILLRTGNQSILIDCGIRFTPDNPLPDLDQLSGVSLNAILITHAHSDHTGSLPLIHEAFPAAPVFMTSPTKDLVGILQRDALRLMNQSDREFEIPLYTEKQVNGMLDQTIAVRHGQRVALGDLTITFLPAGHILGASMIHLETPGGSILFTGDFSVSGQATVPNLKRSGMHVDCIVTEATYGSRLHSDRKLAEKRMIEQIAAVLDAGGKVLIPAFAIGRAQEVIVMLKHAMRRKALPKVPVYVDGMIRSVCDSYRQHESYVSNQLLRAIFKDPHPFYNDMIQPVLKPAQRESIVTGDPCVIISSSGMLHGGPSATYAARLAGNELNAILITGYQDEEAPGRILQNLVESREKRVRLNGQDIDVACKCDTYSLSAHADRLQITGFIESHHPRTVVLVHGDHDSREVLKNCLAGRDTVVPENGESLERAYPVRKTTRCRQNASRVPIMTKQAACALLGPATGKPVMLKDLCEAWFGRRSTGRDEQMMLNQLLEFRLVRRDIESTGVLWPLTAPVTDALPTKEELQREKQLKEENPFGILMEFVMRRKLRKPRILSGRQKRRFITEIQIDLDEEVFTSDPVNGYTESMAKQVAAEVLVRRLSSSLLPADAIPIDDDEADQMRNENYKGRLLEFCHSSRIGRLNVHTEAVPGGYVGWGSIIAMTTGSLDIESEIFSAKSVKSVEHAVCRQLLGQARDAVNKMQQDPGTGNESISLVENSKSIDPLITLNEMKQTSELKDYGFEVTGRTGPPHAPVFTMHGWFQKYGGDREYTESITASSKKEGKRKIADLILLDALRY